MLRIRQFLSTANMHDARRYRPQTQRLPGMRASRLTIKPPTTTSNDSTDSSTSNTRMEQTLTAENRQHFDCFGKTLQASVSLSLSFQHYFCSQPPAWPSLDPCSAPRSQTSNIRPRSPPRAQPLAHPTFRAGITRDVTMTNRNTGF